MKAISIIPQTTIVQLKDWPEPMIAHPDEIKVKVLQVGICGTDREEVHGGRADAPRGEKELIIGHEMLSQVVEVGKNVKTIKPKDLVVISVRRGCNSCPACKMERSDMCTSGNYTERGIKGRHGFQAEFVTDQVKYALKIPDGIKQAAVLAEPMSVVQKAIDEVDIIQTGRLPYIKNQANWMQGKVALIAGLGPIGLLAAIALRLRGLQVVGMDIVPANSPRVSILTQIGGTYFNCKENCSVSIKKNYPMIDIIFDAAGIAKLDFDLLEMLSINGIFVLTGVPGDQRLINIDGANLMRKLVLKNQVMVGSVNESLTHFAKGLLDLQKAVKQWPKAVSGMITNRFAPKDFAKAFGQHSPDEIKAIIDWEL